MSRCIGNRSTILTCIGHIASFTKHLGALSADGQLVVLKIA